MNILEEILQAIVEGPLAEDRWMVLADCLEETDPDPRRAELLRLHRRLLATCCEPDKHPERAMQQSRIVALLGDGVRPCVPQKTVELTGGVDIKFNFVPPGSFLMGSPEEEEGRLDDEALRQEEVTTGYWLAIHPVTQSQWRAVTGTNPSQFKGDSLPVTEVSWEDCLAFCDRLGEKKGTTFRLPTEAEWEYACRAGTTTPFHFGETIATDTANYDGNHTYARGQKGVFRERPTPVGSFPPNAWGLHDMHGNIWEWCRSWHRSYPTDDIADPQYGNTGTARVARGGSWVASPRACRSACRFGFEPVTRRGYVGCRLLCLPG